ncbi:MAG: IS3 family transposase [Chthoniobacter sp.]|nr:IS3 family transposase [Chthoniobacter sp.]
MKSAFEQSRRTYGCPRLRHALAARGHRHGERRIGRLMLAAGLRARSRRRFVPQTTQSRHDGPITPNHLAKCAVPPTRPDEVWAVDMTCIGTAEGWLFLAIVLDLHRRRVGRLGLRPKPVHRPPAGRTARGPRPAPPRPRPTPSQRSWLPICQRVVPQTPAGPWRGS